MFIFGAIMLIGNFLGMLNQASKSKFDIGTFLTFVYIALTLVLR